MRFCIGVDIEVKMSQKLPEFMDIGKNPRNGTNTVNSADVHEGTTRGCHVSQGV